MWRLKLYLSNLQSHQRLEKKNNITRVSRNYKQVTSKRGKNWQKWLATWTVSQPTSLCNLGATNFGYRPGISDRPFTEARKFERLSHPNLAKFSSFFSLVSCLFGLDSWLSVSSQSNGSSLPNRTVLPRRKQALYEVSFILIAVNQCCKVQLYLTSTEF